MAEKSDFLGISESTRKILERVEVRGYYFISLFSAMKFFGRNLSIIWGTLVKTPVKVEYAQSAIEKAPQHEEIKTDNPSTKESSKTEQNNESHEVQEKNEMKNPEYSWKIERLMNDERVSNTQSSEIGLFLTKLCL